MLKICLCSIACNVAFLAWHASTIMERVGYRLAFFNGRSIEWWTQFIGYQFWPELSILAALSIWFSLERCRP